MLKMSPQNLVDIIGQDKIVIHHDPVQNEERLFQIAWNNIQTKCDETQALFIPKILKAVHLPLICEASNTDDFITHIERKVGHNKDAMDIIESARQKEFHLQTEEKPKLDNITKWALPRYQTSGQLAIDCTNLDKQSWLFGKPSLVNGIPWCLMARVRSESSKKYLACAVLCLADLGSTSITCEVKIQLVEPDQYTGFTRRPTDPKVFEHNFTKDSKDRGFSKFCPLDIVMRDYHNVETDSCRFIANITIMDRPAMNANTVLSTFCIPPNNMGNFP